MDNAPITQDTIQPSENEEETEQCTVEKIVGMRHPFENPEDVEYLIKWREYNEPEMNTWEPPTHLEEATTLVDDFRERLEKLRSRGAEAGEEDGFCVWRLGKRRRIAFEKGSFEKKDEPARISRVKKRNNIPYGRVEWVARADGS